MARVSRVSWATSSASSAAEDLERVTQALGGDPHVVMELGFGRIVHGGLEREQLRHAHGEDAPRRFEGGLIGMETGDRLGTRHGLALPGLVPGEECEEPGGPPRSVQAGERPLHGGSPLLTAPGEMRRQSIQVGKVRRRRLPPIHSQVIQDHVQVADLAERRGEVLDRVLEPPIAAGPAEHAASVLQDASQAPGADPHVVERFGIPGEGPGAVLHHAAEAAADQVREKSGDGRAGIHVRSA